MGSTQQTECQRQVIQSLSGLHPHFPRVLLESLKYRGAESGGDAGQPFCAAANIPANTTARRSREPPTEFTSALGTSALMGLPSWQVPFSRCPLVRQRWFSVRSADHSCSCLRRCFCPVNRRLWGKEHIPEWPQLEAPREQHRGRRICRVPRHSAYASTALVESRTHDRNGAGSPVPFTLEHLDASSSVSERDEAKVHLAQATPSAPHAVTNVGIFGEGTDSPNLSAVAFLAPRKSPMDVIQAAGRAMRAAPGKGTGYIVCPALIPPDQDAEHWLQMSGPEDGWQELGQTLRAHDSRIEDNLADQMILCLPPPVAMDTQVVNCRVRRRRQDWLALARAPRRQARRCRQRCRGRGDGTQDPRGAGVPPVHEGNYMPE